jgi:hypothetical protein
MSHSRIIRSILDVKLAHIRARLFQLPAQALRKRCPHIAFVAATVASVLHAADSNLQLALTDSPFIVFLPFVSIHLPCYEPIIAQHRQRIITGSLRGAKIAPSPSPVTCYHPDLHRSCLENVHTNRDSCSPNGRNRGWAVVIAYQGPPLISI